MEEKEEFFILSEKVASEIVDGEKFLIFGDLNGHEDVKDESFEGLHGGHGFEKAEFGWWFHNRICDALNFAVANTWLKKDVDQLGLMKCKVEFVKRCNFWKLKRTRQNAS